MSDILLKAQRSASILADPSIEPWKRVWQSLDALSGLRISDLSESTQQMVDLELGPVSGIISSYDLNEWDDYEQIDGDDIDEMLERIETATKALVDSEVDRVMTGLRTAVLTLPRSEIMDVRQHKELFIPLLIEALEQAVDAVRAGHEPEGESYFFAVFLLTEFEVHAAFPMVLDAFLLHDDDAHDLFGDALHSFFPSVLALFLRNETDRLDDIVQDTGLNIYVRWAALHTYIYWVRDEVMSREAAVAGLHAHLVRCMAANDHELIAPLINALADIAAHETLGTIRDAFAKGLVDTSIVDLRYVESTIDESDEMLHRTLKRCPPTGMPDTIAELSHWASYTEEPVHERKTAAPQNAEPPVPRSDFAQPRSVTPITSDAKVGRNDPCPCGSGRKFKKCCLSNRASNTR